MLFRSEVRTLRRFIDPGGLLAAPDTAAIVDTTATVDTGRNR